MLDVSLGSFSVSFPAYFADICVFSDTLNVARQKSNLSIVVL